MSLKPRRHEAKPNRLNCSPIVWDKPLLDQLPTPALQEPPGQVIGGTIPHNFPLPQAAVLACLVLPHWQASLERTQLLFIKRASHLRRHAGEIAFPGGLVEASDATLLDAGFREAKEEVSLNRTSARVIGSLPGGCTPSGYQVTPFVVATTQQHFVTQPDEVAATHLIDLTELLQCPFRTEYRTTTTSRHRIVAFDLSEICVWGITGAILEELLIMFFGWSPREP